MSALQLLAGVLLVLAPVLLGFLQYRQFSSTESRNHPPHTDSSS